MFKNRNLYLCLAFFCLAGCATSYKEMGFFGEGVKAVPITENMWRITANGNSNTKPEVIKGYVLLKASETVIQAGYTHFVVLDGQGTKQMISYGTPQLSYGGFRQEITIRALPKNASAQEKITAIDAKSMTTLMDILVKDKN